MVKAKLKEDVKLIEKGSWFDPDFHDNADDIVFKKDTEVEVVRHIKSKEDGATLYLIYDETIEDSTVVGEHLLEFED